ncbi:TonB-dependent receptor plug domain-containing protein [Parahaliea maris]|uniref:TonB-dependent receptor plug domain-containing protein n=1 Tax=Parahaliea maris TaxID=2716870 RepID=A0A5C8ZQ92_9GAMM|nr:TonB-dependent receptor [Parahaliea maris]TXS89820.1 TonB-dependent receptor plug domain-containing protein [Parahaliea maris]
MSIFSYRKSAIAAAVSASLCTHYTSTAFAQIEEVIVTAQKREENLQDIPVAVTALTSKQIQEQRIQGVTDLGSKIPSLVVREDLSGNVPLITMRGSLAANPSNPIADKSVSFYMDGVYLGNMNTLMFDVSDIERIEVIRGPAGTLFGTNSTAGAVNYITATPSGEFSARQELSYARFDSLRSKTRIDLPEWKGLSISATYLYNDRGSDVRNANRQTWEVNGASLNKERTVTSARELGWTKTEAFSGAIHYEPFDGLGMDYKFNYMEWRSPGPASQIIGFSGGPGGVAARDIIAAQTFFGGPTLSDYVQQERSSTVYNDMTSVHDNKIVSHFLSAEYQANDYLTIKNIAGWRSVDRGYRLNQLDGAGGVVLPDATGSLQPFSILSFNAASQEEQFSNETQFIVDTNALSLTAGLFYYSRETDPGTYVSSVFPFTSLANNVIPLSFTGSQRDTFYRSRQAAGYGQATYHLTDRIDVTGGVRYTQDAKTIFDGTNEPGNTFDYDEGNATWLASISYNHDESTMVYAKYTTGFVAGGLSALQASVVDPATGESILASVSSEYKKEEAESTEVGVKADFFGSILRTNFALYHVEYDNLQQSQPIQLSVVVPSGAIVPFSSFATTNAGKVRNYGIEYEINAIPVEGLMLSALGAYNDFKMIESPPGIDYGIIRPEFTANLGAEYSFAVGAGMSLSFRADAEYMSSIASAYQRLSTSPALPENVRANDILFQDPRWLLHARATLSDIPLGGATGRLSIWGRNLTDEQRISASGDLGTTYTAVFENPVSYGVDFTVEF